jgi:regulation of enolase protein 1 (concanavalin A-like superfamily)
VKKHLPLIGAALLVCLASPAFATTFYVSPSGGDDRPGTSPTDAWRTLARASEQQLRAGDQLLLQGGATFNGTLYLDRNDIGTRADPIVISSYGSGRATVNAGLARAISVYNTAGIRISNLNVVGSGRDLNTESGVLFFNDLAGDVLLDTVIIEDVTASGFGDQGIEIGSWAGRSGYQNVRILRVTARENGLGGIFTYAMQRAVHRNVYIGYSNAYLNAGFAGMTVPTGNGITMSGVDGGVIEYSVASENGWRCNAASGPVGIWAYSSNNVVLQFNESHHNKTGGTKDGGGFHLDNGTSNSVMQFNYAHDNAGAGYMLAHKDNDYVHSGNAVRWNISQNDGRKNNYAAIQLWGRIRNAQIHNNTVYVAAGNTAARGIIARNTSIETQDLENVTIRNNIVQTTGGIPFVDFAASVLDAATGVRIEGNAYWPTGGAFSIKWRGSTYTSLDEFRAASGQEQLNGRNVGLVVDPRLSAPGAGPTYGDATMLRGLWQYRLKPDSLLIDAGLDLSQFGTAIGARDYFGGPSQRYNGSDVGAHEYDVACNWTLTPDAASLPAAGGAVTVSVWAASDTCGWAVLSGASWISPTTTSGSGPGSVTLSVAANTASGRTATVQIGDRAFTVTEAGSSSTPPPPPGSGTIGSWSYGDIGSTGVAGTSSGNGTSFTVDGAGGDIWGTADAFHFVRQQVTGDVEIVARVTSLERVHDWTKAGVMIRETLDAGSKHAMLVASAAKGMAFQRRTSTGGTSTSSAAGAETAPEWVRLVRTDSSISVYKSIDGATWTAVGTQTLSMASTVYIGLAVTSHDTTTAATVQFTDVVIRVPSSTPPPPPTSALPAPWANRDVGSVGVAGSATLAGTTFTVNGAGADIWGSADQFHYVYQPVSGDVTVVAHVATIQRVHDWTKAGVMIRESLTAGSKHAMMVVSAAKGLAFQRRPTTGGTTLHSAGALVGAPYWVKLTRRGDVFTAFASSDGTTWVTIGSETIPMAVPVYVGLPVTSHSTANAATVTFDSVSIGP